MMRRTLKFLLLSLLLTTIAPLAVMGASSGGSHSAGHDASQSSQKNVIGTLVVDGVDATAELRDVRKAMAEAGQPGTHHLQVAFQDIGTNNKIESGMVAVKVTLPSGVELEASQMISVDGHFGVDLQLSEIGKYTFTVASKFEDGKKRQFVFVASVVK
jgi:hypothetical protein